MLFRVYFIDVEGNNQAIHLEATDEVDAAQIMVDSPIVAGVTRILKAQYQDLTFFETRKTLVDNHVVR